jgi:hypothetical protein
MIIDFNDGYQLETILTKVDSIPDLYQLTMTSTDSIEHISTTDEYFFSMSQLKEFVSYLNKATCDHI